MSYTECPHLDPVCIDTRGLSKLYRVLDILEEQANMAHAHLRGLAKKSSPAAEYISELQEFLFTQRAAVVDELRSRPNSNDVAGTERLSVILQYEAWLREVAPETVQQLATSDLWADEGEEGEG